MATTFEIKLNKETPYLIQMKLKLFDEPQTINIAKMKKINKSNYIEWHCICVT